MKAFELMESLSVKTEMVERINTGSSSFFETFYPESTRLNKVLESYVVGIDTVSLLKKFNKLSGYDEVSGVCLEAIFDRVGLVPSGGDLRREADEGATLIREAIGASYLKTMEELFNNANNCTESLNWCHDVISEATRRPDMNDNIDRFSGERFVTPVTKVDSKGITCYKLSDILMDALESYREMGVIANEIAGIYGKAHVDTPNSGVIKDAIVKSEVFSNNMEKVQEAVLLVNTYNL